jgi:signal transduction histidine kinase
MAQPLTVLRGALGAWKLRGSKAAETDRYLDMSAKQVERMSSLLSSLQDVLDVSDGEPDCVKIDIGELAGLVLEEMASDVRERGGSIDAIALDRRAQIRGDSERTERALRAALRVVLSVSPAEGAIRVSVRSCGERVEAIVENTTKHGKVLGFADRLNLSLVETNVRCQGGEYKLVEDPLCILFTLPSYRPEMEGNMPAVHSNPASFLS